VTIGDGRYEVPAVGTSQGTTRIVFGTVPSRAATRPANADHETTVGLVFANDLALQAITGKTKLFPEGAVLVREKLSKPGDTQPELLAVMIKRERGFNPNGGDWQFLVTNGERTKIKLNQRKGECLDCHQYQSTSDYVHPLK